ncbi:MAG: UDP-N-acetylmuramoyl-tripeptide--D-alanyl-D-alanine ligase [Chitinophagaceae bacterium]
MEISALYAIYKQFPRVQTDTRAIQAEELFFALKGEHFNGNRFAEQALEKGAAYAIIDEAEFAVDARCILVDNVLETLQALAKYHREQFSIPFIAITGSNGKTTTKELVHAVLSKKFKTTATVGNLNNHIGIPLTILRIPMDTEMAIIEMGANHQREIAGYCLYALPTHGIINNCGKAHLEGFGGVDGVRKGKGELYDFLREQEGAIFRNVDLDYLVSMSNGIHRQITYGETAADYTGMVVHGGETLQVAITRAGLEMSIQTQLVGDYNLANILAAVAVGHHFGVSANAIREALEAYTPSNSRSQRIQRDTNTIILDAYNANPSSMRVAIQNFKQMDFPNKVVIIGGMMELGEDSVMEHQQIVELLQESNWNHVLLVGGDFEKTQHAYTFVANYEAAADYLKQIAPSHAGILIKGSRAFTLEKIIQ